MFNATEWEITLLLYQNNMILYNTLFANVRLFSLSDIWNFIASPRFHIKRCKNLRSQVKILQKA